DWSSDVCSSDLARFGCAAYSHLTAIGRLLHTELFLHQRVDGLRIGLAARGLHDLAYEPAGERGLGLGLLHLVGISRNHLVDGLFDGAGVRDLLHAARFDDLIWIAAFIPDDFEKLLGDLTG